MNKFKVSDIVYKTKGYRFVGEIVAIATLKNGEIRYLVELLDSNGLLHIFSENQIELMPNEED